VANQHGLPMHVTPVAHRRVVAAPRRTTAVPATRAIITMVALAAIVVVVVATDPVMRGGHTQPWVGYPVSDSLMESDPLGCGTPAVNMPEKPQAERDRLCAAVKAEADARTKRLASLRPVVVAPAHHGIYTITDGTAIKAVAVRLVAGGYPAATVSVSNDGKAWRLVAPAFGPPTATSLLADLGKVGVVGKYWRVETNAPPNVQTAVVSQVRFLR